MTVLTVSATTNYTTSRLNDVTVIDFDNGVSTSATATFAAGQFDDIRIARDVSISGSVGINHLLVQGKTINAIGWVFIDWDVADSVVLGGTAGDDVILASLATDAVFGGDGNDNLNARGADSLYGGKGNDFLATNQGLIDGGDGVDTMSFLGTVTAALTLDLRDGGGGRDIGTGLIVTSVEAFGSGGSSFGDKFQFGNLSDWVFASAGNDTVLGGGGNDSLNGGKDHDLILGGAGRDILTGSLGHDRMTGGGGADKFAFWSFDDTKTGLDRDVITDFEHGLDLIDLYRIDPLPDPTNDAFVFIGQTAFEDFYAPQVRFFHAGPATIIQIRMGDGAGGEVHEIKLLGSIDLTAGDFIL